jgi:LuxR family maltose regulon positive regulatory protein
VLDDLHLLREPSVYELLEYLINSLPPNMRVVVATRQDPPLGLARRRARGEVAEIQFQDLNFSEDETRALANQRLGLNLSNQEVSQLHSRTEGWAVGLRLLTTSLSQSPGHRTALLQNDLHGSRRIFDFLAEEVLDRQEPDLRKFLLETSILSLLRPEVCDALTGRTDSSQVLEALYRRSLFVVAADEAETSFRYHDLFADFLRKRLRSERPDQWAELHRHAGGAEKAPGDRLHHWIAAGQWDVAAEEIEAIGPEYARRGFVLTLQRWISELPEQARLERPRLLYLLGHAIWTQREFSQAQPYLEQALAGFRRNGDVVGQGETLVALANSAVMNNRFDESSEMIREALALDTPDSGRVQLLSASAWVAIFRQDWTEALKHLDELFQMVKSGAAISNPMALMSVLFAAGLPEYVGRLETLCTVMRLRLSGPPDLAHGWYHIFNSAVLFDRGDTIGSYSDAEKAFSIARQSERMLLLGAALCTNFWLIAAARGDWTAMEAWSNESLEHDKYGQVIRNWRLHSLYQQARARWHLGKLEELRDTCDDAMRPNPVEAPAARPYRSLIRGILKLAERALGQAEQAFREALDEEEGFRVTRAIASARVMLAYTLLLRGQADEAVAVFKPYLEQAEAFNLPGYLIRENPHVVPLLRHAHQRNIHRSYAAHILEMLGAPLTALEAANVPLLSERELEVLLVMAEGLANRADRTASLCERSHYQDARATHHAKA